MNERRGIQEFNLVDTAEKATNLAFLGSVLSGAVSPEMGIAGALSIHAGVKEVKNKKHGNGR